MVFREFDPDAAPTGRIMIRCFLEGLKPSVSAQMNTRSRDLNSWEEAVEKAVNVEIKTMLQSSASTRDMDSRCSRGNRPAKKEEKDSNRKNKSTDSLSANTSSGKQSSSTHQTSFNPKKDQEHQRGLWRRGRGEQGHNTNSTATGVNTIPTKEGKDRDMFKVEYFYYHRKRYYSKKCPQNPKKGAKN